MGSPQVVLGYPSEKEEVTKQWFDSGPVRYVKAMIHNTGHQPNAMGWHYVIPEFCADRQDEEELFLKYREAFAEKLMGLPNDCKVILAVGEIPVQFFQIEGKLLKVRGSTYTWERDGRLFYVVPTFDPEYMLHGNQREEPTFCADVEKVFRISGEGWKPPAEKFDMDLSWDELVARLHSVIERGAMIACDLETTSLNPRNAKIIVLGIAVDGERAFSVPFLKQGGHSCWNRDQYHQLQALLQQVFDSCPTLWQNAAYDIAVLKLKGFTFTKEIHDTMLMHHTYHVELPHNLGYLGSVYADTPYWKDDVLKNPQDMVNIEDSVLRRYNLRDCVVLWPIYHALKLELEKHNVWKIYDRIARRLVHPVTNLEINGMHLIDNRLVEWKKTLNAKVEEWGAKFVEAARLPEGFNPNGKIHLNWLFLGLAPSSLKANLEKYELYVNDSKKRKDTKAFRELEVFVRVFRDTKPFPRLKGGYLKTKTGGYDLGAQGLVKMRLMAQAELEQIESLKRDHPEKEERKLELQRFIYVLGYFGELKKWIKLKSTYGDFPVGSDGRIHPKYNIGGTRTGRLSSSGPNWQNLPPIVKRLFAPERGYCFVEADFSNIEMRTLAYESNDDVLQEQFASGKKIHKENTKVLFGLDKDDDPDNDDSMYKKMYKCAKTYIFGRGYGGSLKGIYERVLLQVPGVELKYGDFVKADEAYRAAHPKYVKWVDRIVASSIETHSVTTAFGRKRWFLDDESKIKRECLNTPNQGTAADVFNVALIGIQQWIDDNEDDDHNVNALLVGAVHDSIIVECKVELRDKVMRAMKAIMEQPFELWGRAVSFPVEFKWGTKSWAELEKVEVESDSDNRRGNDETTGDEQWFFDWGAGED